MAAPVERLTALGLEIDRLLATEPTLTAGDVFAIFFVSAELEASR